MINKSKKNSINKAILLKQKLDKLNNKLNNCQNRNCLTQKQMKVEWNKQKKI